MRNYLIELLGGYTKEDMSKALACIEKLKKDLAQSKKNDSPNDPKTGKFVKKKKKK